MSELVKQNVGSTELPTGSKYGYGVNPVNGAVTMFYSAADGLYSQSFAPFPPTNYSFGATKVFGWLQPGEDVGDQPVHPATLDIIRVVYTGTGEYYILLQDMTNRRNFVFCSRDKYIRTITALSGTQYWDGCLYGGFHNAVYVPEVWGTFICVGLGRMYNGAANFTIGTPASAVAVNANYCEVNEHNEVVNYGVFGKGFRLGANNYQIKTYVLLKRSGEAAVHTMPQAGSPGSLAYVRYTVPVGGEIKYFADGIYIASDAAGNDFLYTINGTGTLVCELTGSYDASTTKFLVSI